jgi:hypothetical protein
MNIESITLGINSRIEVEINSGTVIIPYHEFEYFLTENQLNIEHSHTLDFDGTHSTIMRRLEVEDCLTERNVIQYIEENGAN